MQNVIFKMFFNNLSSYQNKRVAVIEYEIQMNRMWSVIAIKNISCEETSTYLFTTLYLKS